MKRYITVMVMASIKIMATMLIVLCMFSGSVAYAISEKDFQTVGRKYGVSPFLLQAISQFESQHGELLGEYVVCEVVDDTQLKYLKKIAKHTGRLLCEFTGSPAGAMGLMQMVPSTFYEHAQDGDGDGIKDPLNPYDSLATAAYFIARMIAAQGNVRAALKKYNNSAVYCQKVLTASRKLEAESQLAAR